MARCARGEAAQPASRALGLDVPPLAALVALFLTGARLVPVVLTGDFLATAFLATTFVTGVRATVFAVAADFLALAAVFLAVAADFFV